MLMKTRTTKFLTWKRNFTSQTDLALALGKYLDRRYAGNITCPFLVKGHTFTGCYDKRFAVSVVLGQGKKDCRPEVAYQLHLMETLEKSGDIQGGVVIYVTSHVSEWKPNDCIAIEPNGKHNGKPFTLTNKYYEDWNGATSAKRKFALFFTKGAMNRIDS